MAFRKKMRGRANRKNWKRGAKMHPRNGQTMGYRGGIRF